METPGASAAEFVGVRRDMECRISVWRLLISQRHPPFLPRRLSTVGNLSTLPPSGSLVESTKWSCAEEERWKWIRRQAQRGLGQALLALQLSEVAY